MTIQLGINQTTGYLTFPPPEPIETGGDRIVETHGTIPALTDDALENKFSAADKAQSDDFIWVVIVGTNNLYQMNAGATDARLPASWSAVTPQSVVSSGALDATGIIQSPLRDLPGLQGLSNFQSAPGTYLVQQTPGNDSSWAIGRITQFGTTLDDLFFRTAGFAITAPTIVWVEDAGEAYLLDPSGSRSAITVHTQITGLTSDELTNRFEAANSASPGDLIWAIRTAQQNRYRMKQGASDARLAASWTQDNQPNILIDDTLPLVTTSTNPVQAQAIAARLATISSGVQISTGTTMPNNQTPGNIYIFNGPDDTPSRLYVKFTEGWAGLIMPSDFQ